MNSLPKDLEDIIIDYKEQLEREEHKEKFKKTLDIIKSYERFIQYNRTRGPIRNPNRNLYTSPDYKFVNASEIWLFHKNHRVYKCHIYSICRKCNNFLKASGMELYEISPNCICIC